MIPATAVNFRFLDERCFKCRCAQDAPPPKRLKSGYVSNLPTRQTIRLVRRSSSGEPARRTAWISWRRSSCLFVWLACTRKRDCRERYRRCGVAWPEDERRGEAAIHWRYRRRIWPTGRRGRSGIGERRHSGSRVRGRHSPDRRPCIARTHRRAPRQLADRCSPLSGTAAGRETCAVARAWISFSFLPNLNRCAARLRGSVNAHLRMLPDLPPISTHKTSSALIFSVLCKSAWTSPITLPPTPTPLSLQPWRMLLPCCAMLA